MTKSTKDFSNDPELKQLLEELEPYAHSKHSVSHSRHTELQAITRKLSRAVMRYPSQEVTEQLYILHGILKDQFSTMPTPAIEWLLGGAPVARGRFNDDTSFKSFFDANPRIIPPSRLITGLETIATAMSYRALDAEWADPPIKPYDSDRLLMYIKIKALLPKDSFVPHIGEAYIRDEDQIDNKNDDLFFDSDVQKNRMQFFPDDISDVSDVEYPDKEKRPTKALPVKSFKEKPLLGIPQYTWPAGAHHGNIPSRSHVSGTAPLVLHVINRLFVTQGHAWIEQDDNVRKLAGAILCPTYERGDFHTIAETAAGTEYYLEARQPGNNTKTTLSPQEAFKCALQHMTSATDEKLHTILKKISPFLISKTRDLPVLSRIDFKTLITILKNSTALDKFPLNKFISKILKTDFVLSESKAIENLDKLAELYTAFKNTPYYSFSSMDFSLLLKLFEILNNSNLKSFSPEEIAKTKTLLSTMVSEFNFDLHDTSTITFLSLDVITLFCESLQPKLAKINLEELGSLLSLYQSDQVNAMCKGLKTLLPTIIKTPEDVKTIEQLLTPELNQVLHENLKAYLPHLIQNEVDKNSTTATLPLGTMLFGKPPIHQDESVTTTLHIDSSVVEKKGTGSSLQNRGDDGTGISPHKKSDKS